MYAIAMTMLAVELTVDDDDNAGCRIDGVKI
jgi:hypothetical protein